VRLPRDISGTDLIKALSRVGYRVTRQTGSHVRLTRDLAGLQHITIPAHDPLKVGTSAALFGEVAQHLEVSRDGLLERLFG